MSPITALRGRRSIDGLPPMPSDDELLAWSEALTAPAGPAPSSRPRRTQALRAARHENHLGLEELFVEIESRATDVARRRRLRIKPT
jgi:hypothetical protein